MRTPTTVMVVEDHLMLVDALREALDAQEDLEVVATADSLAGATAALHRTCPDVVLMDVALPDGDGAAAAGEVLRRCPSTKVLVLSAQSSIDVVARAVEHGAAGFVPKTTPLADLVQAIRLVAGGASVFEPQLLRQVTSHLRTAAQRPGADLTAREREVLQLLTEAATVDDIAARLVLSPHTVRNHVRGLMGKLGAHTQLEAVVIAARHGLVDLGDAAGR